MFNIELNHKYLNEVFCIVEHDNFEKLSFKKEYNNFKPYLSKWFNNNEPANYLQCGDLYYSENIDDVEIIDMDVKRLVINKEKIVFTFPDEETAFYFKLKFG